MPLHVPTPGVTEHTELTDKEVADVIDHATESVTTPKIKDLNVTEGKLADESVTTSKVKDLNITDPKLASGVGLLDGQICKLPTAVVDQILKRGATAWEVGIPTVAESLEDEYTSWAIYDSFDDSDFLGITDWGQYSIANRAETKIILILLRDNFIKSYDIASKVVTDLGFTDPLLGWGAGELESQQHSKYGTYFVVVDDRENLKIIKGGAVIQTLSDSDLGIDSGKIRAADISPKGKYITISCTRSATSNPGWVILVGS